MPAAQSDPAIAGLFCKHNMRSQKIFWLQVFVVMFLSYWYVIVGIDMNWAMEVWWWDSLAHAVGGFWVVLCAVIIGRSFKIRLSLVQCLLAAFLLGLVWEIYEYFVDIYGSVFLSYAYDTGKDFILDMLGGALAWVVSRYI